MRSLATGPLFFLSLISAAIVYESSSTGHYMPNVSEAQKVHKGANNSTAQSQEQTKTSQPDVVASPYDDEKHVFTSCASADRRALAANPTATEAHWKAMTECTVRSQTHDKLGHFFLHVSKSGGTSMRAAMDAPSSKCFRSGRNQKKLFYVLQRPDTQWFKHSRLQKEGLELEKFGRIDHRRVKGDSCHRFESVLHQQGRLAVESESVIALEAASESIPEHARGGCRKLINSILFREPLARIESHYKHLQSISKKGKSADKMFLGDGQDQVFNVEFMAEVFDVVSDNYYTRSLVAKGIFENDHALTQHPEAWTTLFPTANASLHNIDWIMLMGSPNENEAEDRNLIIQNGLGLGSAVNLGHSRPGSTQLKKSKLSNERLLRDRNALDYKL